MTDDAADRSIAPLVAIGAVAGVASGLFGIGGGVLMVPAMVALTAMPQHRAHATSLAAIAPIAGIGAVIFGGAGNVDAAAAAALIAGSVLGVQLGTRLMGGVSARRLAQGFGVFLIAVALALVVR